MTPAQWFAWLSLDEEDNDPVILWCDVLHALSRLEPGRFDIAGDNGASAEGTIHGAWSSLSFQNGRPEDPEPPGDATLTLVFDYDGGGLGKGGTARLLVDGTAVVEGRIDKTVPFIFSMSGETFDIGEDTGAPVGPYESGFPFTGTIKKVTIALRSAHDEPALQAMHAGHVDAAMKAQ
jgi:hypothetical protein